jgi:phage shock protein PspC (stress-responsive transcriptional regulator)
MKKTLTINISGSVFHIDEDAYEKLKTYLSKISAHFNRENDGRKIINDIESRITELFTAKLSPEHNVVDVMLVDQIIGMMGMPEDFADVTHEEPESETTSNQQYNYPKSKKLYRDPNSSVIAGVCGGLAHYLNMDRVLVRVLFILLFLLTSGVALPFYIILWIAVPKARSTAQLLEMRGEAINVENIGKKVKEGTTEKKDGSAQNSTVTSNQPYYNEYHKSGPSVLSKIIGLILIIGGFMSFLGLIIGVVATSKLLGLIPGIFHSPDDNMLLNHIFSHSLGSTMVISILIIVGIPLLLIIYFGTKLMFNFVSNSQSVFISALGIWVLGIIIAMSSAAGAVNVFSTSATINEPKNLAIPADTIYLKLDKSEFDSYNYKAGVNNVRIIDNGKKERLIASPRFTIEKSRGNYIELTLNKYAKGNNYRSAKDNASKIEYGFSVEGDTLLLDPYFEFGKRDKWRSQSIDVTLTIPEGKVVYINDNLAPVIHRIENISNTWEGDMTGKYWEMKPEGLTLIK